MRTAIALIVIANTAMPANASDQDYFLSVPLRSPPTPARRPTCRCRTAWS